VSTSATGQTDNRVIAFPAGSVVQKPLFLDGVRSIVRARHYSSRTEKAYIGWIRRLQGTMGSRLAFDRPATPEQGGQNAPRFVAGQLLTPRGRSR
jgi:hypothetical protein